MNAGRVERIVTAPILQEASALLKCLGAHRGTSSNALRLRNAAD